MAVNSPPQAPLTVRESRRPSCLSRAPESTSARRRHFRRVSGPTPVRITETSQHHQLFQVAYLPTLAQVVRFAAPALMAGNAGLLKHASNVPQAALYLGTLFERAGFPEGSFATLLIGASRVDGVIRDRRVAAVTLTGSEGAGRAIGATAGDVLKKAVLELGGSDPFIVMPSANLEAAVEVAVKARTLNNGQACINSKRFIVHSDIYDQFAAKFAVRMGALVVGDPADASTDIGPLATEQGLLDIEELVDDARAKGAQILTGLTFRTSRECYLVICLVSFRRRCRRGVSALRVR